MGRRRPTSRHTARERCGARRPAAAPAHSRSTRAGARSRAADVPGTAGLPRRPARPLSARGARAHPPRANPPPAPRHPTGGGPVHRRPDPWSRGRRRARVPKRPPRATLWRGGRARQDAADVATEGDAGEPAVAAVDDLKPCHMGDGVTRPCHRRAPLGVDCGPPRGHTPRPPAMPGPWSGLMRRRTCSPSTGRRAGTRWACTCTPSR